MDIKRAAKDKVSEAAGQERTRPPDPFGEPVPQDLRKAECPYCQSTLQKVPAAEDQCPRCRHAIYVRTRPQDHIQMVVRKEEAERIDAAWRVARSAPEPDFRYLVTKAQVDAERRRLTQDFLSRGSRPPSEDDVKWGLLNKLIIENAKSGGWGFYRNIRLMMADYLTRRMHLKDALWDYLEVWTLDISGAANSPGIPQLVEGFPAVDPGRDRTTPMVVRQIRLIARELEMNLEMLKAFYLADDPPDHTKLPLSSEANWAKLVNVLREVGEDV